MTIRPDVIEESVLAGLKKDLMHPDVINGAIIGHGNGGECPAVSV